MKKLALNENLELTVAVDLSEFVEQTLNFLRKIINKNSNISDVDLFLDKLMENHRDMHFVNDYIAFVERIKEINVTSRGRPTLEVKQEYLDALLAFGDGFSSKCAEYFHYNIYEPAKSLLFDSIEMSFRHSLFKLFEKLTDSITAFELTQRLPHLTGERADNSQSHANVTDEFEI